MWMCSLCRLPVAENHNSGQILTLGGLLYRPAFTNEGQIWCAKADRTSTLTCRISSECVHCVAFRWPKTTILGTFHTWRYAVWYDPRSRSWSQAVESRKFGHLQRVSHPLKMAEFPTFNSLWPWPWPWIMSYCITSCMTYRPLSTYWVSFKQTKLCGRTDIQMGGQTFNTHFIRSTRRSPPKNPAPISFRYCALI